MRILLLALMIVLLPLRGWMGDVTAMEMSSGRSFATQNIANDAGSTGARAQFHMTSEVSHTPCHEHDGATTVIGANTPESQGHPSHGQCSNCNVCQICYTVAAATAVRFDLGAPQQPRPADGMQFASATSAPSLKPPIS